MHNASRGGAVAIAIFVVGVTLGGCSSGSSTKANNSTNDKSTTTTKAEARNGGTSNGSVDLTITGSTPATITGTKTSCTTSGGSNGTDKVVSFGITGTDYPALGTDGGIGITPVGEQVTEQEVKVTINGTQSAAFGAGITFSADGRTATVDTDLSGLDGTTTGHISGTITCP